MEKNEVLEKSRKENRGGDERDAQITAKAWRLAAAVGIMLCGITSSVYAIVYDKPTPYILSNTMIWLGMVATVYTVRAVRLKTKSDIVFAVIMGAMFVVFTVLFAMSFRK